MADTDGEVRDAGEAERLQAGATAVYKTLKQEAGNLAETATGAIRNAASSGKDRASDALDEFAKLADDAARQVDERLGGTMGDYARKVSTSVTQLSEGLRGKEVDELLDDAKTLIRTNAAAAVGIAAAAGFLIARLIKLGVEADQTPKTSTVRSDEGRGA